MRTFRAEVEWLLKQAATRESRAAFLAREPGPDEVALPGDGYIVPRDEAEDERHDLANRFTNEMGRTVWIGRVKWTAGPTGPAMTSVEPSQLWAVVSSLTARCLALQLRLNAVEDIHVTDEASRYRLHRIPAWSEPRETLNIFNEVLKSLLRRKQTPEEDDIAVLAEYLLNCEPRNCQIAYCIPTKAVANTIAAYVANCGGRDMLQETVAKLAQKFCDETYRPDHQKLGEHLKQALGGKVRIPIEPGEAWSDQALADINSMLAVEQQAWTELVQHAQSANAAKPSKKWLKTGKTLIDTVGREQFVAQVLAWLPLLDRPRTVEIPRQHEWEPDQTHMIIDKHVDILKGFCWLLGDETDPTVGRAICALTLSAYRKVPGKGPRMVKVGNAGVYALGNMAGLDAVGQLALLKIKVKFGTAQKQIEKALTAAAEREGLPRDEIEEMAVPGYGLGEIGVRREVLGEFTAELVVTGTTSTELRWQRADGKSQKSIPKAVKENHADDLKELKAAAKDIQKMLPAQRDRIDQLLLSQQTWAYKTWAERYLDHPLVGTLARRLIWTFRHGEDQPAIEAVWLDDRLVDAAGKPVDIDTPAAIVSLWHPIGHDHEEIIAWRRFFEEREIKQPFKQAHREVYLLTDAERNTATYSNRYASHIIRQHQFNALCAARGWRNKLRLMVDDEYPPASRDLPAWNLRAEFWIDGVGEDYGVDTNDAGTYLYLATDQVRFYRLGAAENYAHAGGGEYRINAAGPGEEDINEPLPLTEIPPLVLSEILRDVDLFVGVASVGNDPQWQDGGPEGRYRDYWHNFSFGDLSATAQSRRELLERLVPRLKIADRCSFDDKFLVVRGDVRTYKIHLGSSNILMMPNDEYLCIVPGRGRAAGPAADVFLPFDGDERLSIILSKAFLLADDTKITDTTILSQIGQR